MRTHIRSQRGGAETVILTIALTLAAVVGLGAAWWMAQPDRSLTQFERLGAEIGCVCGTCPNRPIATCGCGFADGMLDELQVAIAGGGTDEEIVDTIAANYGNGVRIKPTSSGFDLTAWAAPMLALTVGGVLLGAMVLRWSRREDPAPDDDEGLDETPDDLEPDQEARLRAEVERELESYES